MHHRPGNIDLEIFKVNVTPLEANQFAATQPGNPIQRYQRPLAERKLREQGLNLTNVKHIGGALPLCALPDLADWIRILRKPLVADRVIEQSVHDVPDLCLSSSCHLAAALKGQS